MRFATTKRRNAPLARTARRLGLVLAAVLFLTPRIGAAQAQTLASLPSVPSVAQPLGTVRPIAAWVTFCESYPSECALDREEPARITLTPATWATILSVNRRVNKAVQPMTDMDHWHVADRWNLAEDGFGDCEDYQLLKRHLLAKAGLPRRAMRMTVVVDSDGEGHAVLTLLTNRGDLILDNKTSQILPWDRTGYIFVKRESQDDLAWVALHGVGSPATTANR
ncbi:transglutaminase-like cysteine peptidase [Methylobacterium sp. P31]